jgi:hypothetical protein
MGRSTTNAGGTAAPVRRFARFSAVLTGEKHLPDDLVKAYFDRAHTQLKDRLDALLTKFEGLVQGGKDPAAAIREGILPDPDLGAAAKVVLLLWYLGGIQNAAGDWEMASADQYYRALVWEAIGAHPPTLSNGYYGHWKYPPEM